MTERAGEARTRSSSGEEEVEVAIVGGGPAGLAAALWLSRFGRRVRVLDTGEPRNAPTWAVHGYPGIPDLPPHELRRRLREQAQGAGALATEGEVVDISGAKERFVVRSAGGDQVRARRVLLAFGRRDELPDLPRARELYGVSLFHCPDCDGPSGVGAAVGVIGSDLHAASLALYLSFWATSVTLLANGESVSWGEDVLERLGAAGVGLTLPRIVNADAQAGRLRRIVLEGGESLPLACIFFHSQTVPACGLASDLGCECDADGHLRVDTGGETTVPGVFAAGDITGHPYLAASAAAEGVRAALTIHRSLLPDSFRL